jgi:putative phage-type endonuclease
MEQRSPEWFAARRTRLTASDVASVIGRNAFKTSIDVLLDKLGMGVPFAGNEATAHGQKYEDVAIDIYERQTGKRVLRPAIEYHKTIEGVAGSPDGVTEDGILIEVKVRLS